MFAWAAGGGPSLGIDPEQERKPPPSPTQLEFPEYHGLQDNESQGSIDFDAIYKMLLTLRKPQDVTFEHVKALNLTIQTEIEGHQIVPDEYFEGLPPLVWEKSGDDNVGNSGAPTMGNGAPYPSFEKYDIVRKELLFDPDDAYREVTRMSPRPGRERVRVTQTRKFWAGLERMAQFWDTSLDQYYEKPVAATESNADGTQDPQPYQLTAETVEDKPTANINDVKSGNETGAYERVYKGRRIGTGREMPSDVREDTMRGLLEMVAWPFQCQASVPPLLPRLSVQGLLFPVRHTLVAGRVPQDRQSARGGILEGPILGIQCRDETTFHRPGEEPGYTEKEFCDVFREVGAMLLLAQERSREGTVEVKPGEGKWWTTVPRFGGAEHNGVTGEAASTEKEKEKEKDSEKGRGCEDQKSDNDNDVNRHKRSRYANPLIPSRRSGRTRKLTVSEKWKIIEPGPSLWDKRMKYMQIGKPKNTPYDDIFMLSQINHHVSILHLRVHRRYLECLTKGNSGFSEQNDGEQPWNVLKLRRSKWYDLLDAGQRLEAFHSLWKTFHYLMRGEQD